jgi:hypothetical protein
MRTLSAQHNTIRIASIAGEMRDVKVSGTARAQLLWLFRNFTILDFSLLDRRQQRLIQRVWGSGTSVAAADDFENRIGTVERFSPQLHQADAFATRPSQHAQLNLRTVLRTSATWSAVCALLLGCVLYLWPTRGEMPQPRVVAARAAAPASSTLPTVAHVSALPQPVTKLLAPSTEAPRVPPVHLPGAMAADATAVSVKPPVPQGAVRKTGAAGKPQVIIRVSVDSHGRANRFQVLRGDKREVPAALNAARLWHFQSCSDSAGCEHSLGFTYYGDASFAQIIE